MSLLAIAGVWTSCSIDEEVTTPAQLQSREVTFGVQGATPQVVSRTTGTTAEYVDAFVVSGTDDKTSMGVEGIYGDNKRTLFWNFSIARSADGSYDYSPKRYYQNDVTSATFFAYSPVSNNVKHDGVAGANVDNLKGEVDGTQDGSTKKPSVTFDYKVEMPNPNGDTSQEDLLVAWSGIDKAGIYGNKKVTLDFVHALSRVFVTGQNKTTTPVRIKNLQFVNLFEDGTATVTGSTTGKGMPVGGSGTDFVPVKDVVKWSDHQNRVYDGDEVNGRYRYILSESGVFLEPSMKHGEVNGDPKWLVSKEQGMMVIPQILLGDFEVKAAGDIKHSADVVAAAATSVAAALKATDDAAIATTNIGADSPAPSGAIGDIAAVVADITGVINEDYVCGLITCDFDSGKYSTVDKDGYRTSDIGVSNAVAAGHKKDITDAGMNDYKKAYDKEYKKAFKETYDTDYKAYEEANPTKSHADIVDYILNTAGTGDTVHEKAHVLAQAAGDKAQAAAVAKQQRIEIVEAIEAAGIVDAFTEKTVGINDQVAKIHTDISAIGTDLEAIKDAVATVAAANLDANGKPTGKSLDFENAYNAACTDVDGAKAAAKDAVDHVATAFAYIADAISPTTSTSIGAVETALDNAKKNLSTATDNAVAKLGTVLDELNTNATSNAVAQLVAVISNAKGVASDEVASDKYLKAVALADAVAAALDVSASIDLDGDGTDETVRGITPLAEDLNASPDITTADAATLAKEANAIALEAAVALSGVYNNPPAKATNAGDDATFALRVDYELSNLTQTTYIRLGSNFEFEPSKQYLINLVIEGRAIEFDVKVAGFADPEYVNWEPIVTP